MTQEILKAIDAGKKEISVSVFSDGKDVSISTPYETITLSQKDIERILATGRGEKKVIAVTTTVGKDKND